MEIQAVLDVIEQLLYCSEPLLRGHQILLPPAAAVQLVPLRELLDGRIHHADLGLDDLEVQLELLPQLPSLLDHASELP